MKKICFVFLFLFATILIGCGEEPHTHNYSEDYSYTDEYHYKSCSCNDQIKEAHTGGTATCQELAVCEVCNAKYGVFLPCDYEEQYDEDSHWLECNMCHDIKDEVSHTFDLTSDETYHYHTCGCGVEIKIEHSGGTATCQELAICEVCNTSYGELLPCHYEEQHNEDTHWLECNMCHDIKDEVSHTHKLTNDEEYHYHTCSCGYQIKESHTGGSATCQVLKSCSVCNTSYGELLDCYYEEQYAEDTHWLECNMCHDIKDEVSHTYELTSDEEYHYHTCSCGYQIKESHTGGTATCQVLKSCSVCNTSYGELLDCYYEEQYAEDTHWLECNMCHAIKDEVEHTYELTSDETHHYNICECGSQTIKIKHEYDNGTITLPATDMKDGIKTFSCVSCDHSIEKTIPKVDGYEVESYPQLSNADVVYYDGNIYTYGGNAFGRTNSIYRYSIEDDKLYKLFVKLDLPTTSHRVVLVGSKVYLFGGLGSSRRTTILVHDLEAQTLDELDVELPFGINCFQIGCYENTVYIVGGTGANGNFNKIYSFDLETYEFKELPVSLPSVVFKGAWCIVDKYVYVIGGTKGPRLTSIYRFDMETHEVKTMNGTLPEAISQSRAAYDGEGNIYIYGGTNESNQLVDYIVKYNIESDTAELMDYKLPIEIANTCVAATEKGIYILGGNNDYIDVIIKHYGDEVVRVREEESIV